MRSIVGRFLEHTRVFYFENGGKPLVYCSSADWMGRNLHRRVETCFPVLDRRLKRRIYKEGLEPYLADDTQAWLMQGDGSYERAVRNRGAPHCLPEPAARQARRDRHRPHQRQAPPEGPGRVRAGQHRSRAGPADARELIEETVLRDAPTLLFVEHNAAFLDLVSTRCVELMPSSYGRRPASHHQMSGR